MKGSLCLVQMQLGYVVPSAQPLFIARLVGIITGLFFLFLKGSFVVLQKVGYPVF